MAKDSRLKVTDDDVLLSLRLREERQRLGMSVSSVAHYCGVSHSTVTNWEANKARIPLVAAMELWRRGFDIEYLVATDESVLPIKIYDSNGKHGVPRHLIYRHRLSEHTGLIYPNRHHRAEEFSPAGELCLIRSLEDEENVFVEHGSGAYLVKPRKKGQPEFLCKIRVRSKNKVAMSSGGIEVMLDLRTLFARVVVLGKYLCGVGLISYESTDPSSLVGSANRHTKSFLMTFQDLR